MRLGVGRYICPCLTPLPFLFRHLQLEHEDDVRHHCSENLKYRYKHFQYFPLLNIFDIIGHLLLYFCTLNDFTAGISVLLTRNRFLDVKFHFQRKIDLVVVLA